MLAFLPPASLAVSNQFLQREKRTSIHIATRFFLPTRVKNFATMSTGRSTELKPTILVTNDDGIDPEKTLAIPIARELAAAGHDVTVVAPGRNNSACGQSITLFKPLTLRRHPQYEKKYQPVGESAGKLRVFSVLEGTPSDCTAAAIEPKTGLLALMNLYARFICSGVNLGPNFGTDVLYSGTVAGARQGAFYGIPCIATSLAEFNLKTPNRAVYMKNALRATAQVVNELLRSIPVRNPSAVKENGISTAAQQAGATCNQSAAHAAFLRGELFLNMNIAGEWNSKYMMTSLDEVLYAGAVRLEQVPAGGDDLVFKLHGGGVNEIVCKKSDRAAVKNGFAALTVLQTYPWSSPKWVPVEIMQAAATARQDGLPAWLPNPSHATLSS